MSKKDPAFHKNEKHPKKTAQQKEIEGIRKRFEKLHEGLSEVDFKNQIYPEGTKIEIDANVFVDIINALSGSKMFLMKVQESQQNLINAIANNAEYLDGTILPVMELHLSNIREGKTQRFEPVDEQGVEEPSGEKQPEGGELETVVTENEETEHGDK